MDKNEINIQRLTLILGIFCGGVITVGISVFCSLRLLRRVTDIDSTTGGGSGGQGACPFGAFFEAPKMEHSADLFASSVNVVIRGRSGLWCRVLLRGRSTTDGRFDPLVFGRTEDVSMTAGTSTGSRMIGVGSGVNDGTSFARVAFRLGLRRTIIVDDESSSAKLGTGAETLCNASGTKSTASRLSLSWGMISLSFSLPFPF